MKKTLLSAIVPSGNLHIGNYLGAIRNWVELQKDYRCIFFVGDHHAITVQPDPEQLRNKTLEVARIYLAAGLDPKQCLFFIQSHVPEHTELSWIFGAHTKVAEMERMTQFKDKASRLSSNIGLMSYPMLMAADILLYDTDLVPVGEDQTQHLEYARTIGRRFNKTFSDDLFVIPRQYTPKQGARIMALDDPHAKMSKSSKSAANYLAFSDSEDVLRKKVMRAVTDSGSEMKFDQENKPAIANLMNIYSLLEGITIKETEKRFSGKGYGDFKRALAESVVSFMKPYQDRMAALDNKTVISILKEGADEAKKIASKKLERVKELMGYIA